MEKREEELRKAADRYKTQDCNNPYALRISEHKINAFIEGANWQMENQKSEWISVEDRLPEGRILECLGFNVDAPIYNQHVFRFTWFEQDKAMKTDSNYRGTITHWMPLPQPPKTI